MPQCLSLDTLLLVFQGMSYVPLAHRKSFETAFYDHQADLARLCRVSRAFYDLASTSLYTYPVVHSLALFIKGVDDPPIRGLKSKADLLARTERLFLESIDWEKEGEPISDEAVEEYAVSIGDAGGDKEKLRAEMGVMAVGGKELAAWRRLLNGPPGLIFPRLKTVSTGAMSAGPHGWASSAESPRTAELYQQSQDALSDFISETPTVRHFCETGTGILSLGDRLLFNEEHRDLMITHHSDIYNPEFKPTCMGIDFQWLVHTDNHLREDSRTDVALHDSRRAVEDMLRQRRDLADEEEEEEEHAAVADWSIRGGLYLGIAKEEDEAEDEQARVEVRKWAEYESRETRGMFPLFRVQGKVIKDSFEIKPLFDASCDACGWSGVNARRPPGFGEAMDEFEAEV